MNFTNKVLSLLLFTLTIGAGSALAATVDPNGSFSGSYNSEDPITTTFRNQPGDWKLGTTTTVVTVPSGGSTIAGKTTPYLGKVNNLS